MEQMCWRGKVQMVFNNMLVKLSKKQNNILVIDSSYIGGSSYQYMEKIFIYSAKKLHYFLFNKNFPAKWDIDSLILHLILLFKVFDL